MTYFLNEGIIRSTDTINCKELQKYPDGSVGLGLCENLSHDGRTFYG